MTSTVKWFLIASIAGLILGSYVAVYRAGARSERVSALAKSIEIIRERGKTNESIRTLDDPAICRELGGVWVNGDCE